MDQNLFFFQQDAEHVAGDRARTFMSRMEMRASNLINSFIFVDCHKQNFFLVVYLLENYSKYFDDLLALR